MTAFQWLILTLALVIILPVLWMAAGHFLRRRDFKRQIEGKRPERRAGENMRLPDRKPDINTDLDMDMAQWEGRIRQNKNWMNR